MDQQVKYSVSLSNSPLVNASVIDMDIKNYGLISSSNRIKSSSVRHVSDSIISPVPEKRRIIKDIYNELTINFQKPVVVVFRVYDDGVAYRIATRFKDSITINNETAIFNFADAQAAYFAAVQKREDADKFHTSFEELYPLTALDSIANDALAFSPVLLTTSSETKIAVTESDLEDYPGMFLSAPQAKTLEGVFAPYPLEERITAGDYPQYYVTKRADYIAKTNGTRSFPWRVLMITTTDKQLPSSDLVYRLGAPSRIGDASWVQPGKGTDEWIIDVNLFNVPFKSGVNTASYKYYIDFAKRFGLNRIMMDAGWSATTDLFKMNPNINMDTITAYAKQQGIKLSMWTLAATLDRQLDSALDRFNKWGVDFIMTDFIDRDDQKTVNFYYRIAKACAAHKIMIMYHGAFPPKGFNRTYPNNVTREGVLGSEYNAWSSKPSPEHNVTIPFTRMLAGPLDYEPGILDNATQQQFRPVWGKVMSQGTRCQQAAMFVVYDSPLQLFSGNPSQGFLEPEFMQLVGSVPTLWDETKVLEAKVANYIITARKKGNDWFIGGMTDWNARDFSLSLSFLDSGNFNAEICRDGINADRNAGDYIIEKTTVNNSTKLNLHMAPGGGFLIRLTKQ